MPGTDMSRLTLGFAAMAVMLALTVLGMRAAALFFGPRDPRRAVAIRLVLWIGTAVLVVILLAIRR